MLACLQYTVGAMKKPTNLSGQVFGKVTALRLADDYVKGKAKWLCQCECGNLTVAFACNLVRFHTTSCGCHKAANYLTMNLTHGATAGVGKNDYPRLYKTWRSMRQRCFDQNDPAFLFYGGRGITVCDQWSDYATFAADMGEPGPGLSLDRIDNDGPYAPGNCRWATRSEHARNKRSARLLTYNGETRSIVEWAEHLGIPRGPLALRVWRGWDVDRIFSQPYRNS